MVTHTCDPSTSETESRTLSKHFFFCHELGLDNTCVLISAPWKQRLKDLGI